jgi:hypothetical protein
LDIAALVAYLATRDGVQLTHPPTAFRRKSSAGGSERFSGAAKEAMDIVDRYEW